MCIRDSHWALQADAPEDPRLGGLGHRWIAPPAEPAEGWLAHRLSLGVAEGVAELGQDKTLWLECNAAELNGVSSVSYTHLDVYKRQTYSTPGTIHSAG